MAVRLQAISTDYILGAVNWKAPVDVASTVNIALGSLIAGFSVDSITLITGHRVLLKDQTTASQNGVYVIASSGTKRDIDFDADVSANSFKVTVKRGTTNSSKTFICTAPVGSDIIGTDDLTFIEEGSAGGTLSVGNGGTGNTVLTSGNVLVGNGTSPVLTTKPAPAGDFVGTTDAQTLTNKTFISTSQSISNGTQSIILTPGGTGATSTTLVGQQTSNITVTLPAFSGTLATLNNVTAAIEGLTVKTPVKAATTGTTFIGANYPTIIGTPTYNPSGGTAGNGNFSGNLVTSGVLTIDSVPFITGDRVLLKDQTDGVQNGVYFAIIIGATFSLDRAPDFNSDSEVVDGSYVWVGQGTVNADTSYVLSTNNPIIVGFTPLVFIFFTRLDQVIAGNGIVKSGQTLSTNILANGGIIFNSGAMQVDLSASNISGVLSVADGGTGAASFTAGNVLVGNGAAAPTATKPAPFGDFVGTFDVQTLSNKALSSAGQIITNSGANIILASNGGIGTSTTIAATQNSNITLNLPITSGTMVLTSQCIASSPSSNDMALIRWSGPTGTASLNSGVILDNSNNMTGVNRLTLPSSVSATSGLKFGSVDALGPRPSGYYFAGAGNFTATATNNFIAGTGLAGSLITTGNNNTGYGFTNSSAIVDGNQNSCFGYTAGNSISSGNNNSIFGGSGNQLTTGSQNTILGDVSGNAYTGAESNNIIVGYAIGGTTGESNTIRIGNSVASSAYLQGIYNQSAATGAQNVVINSNGKLGVGYSGGATPYAQGDYNTTSFATGVTLALTVNIPEEVTTGGIFAFVSNNGFATSINNRIEFVGEPTISLVTWSISSLIDSPSPHNMVVTLRKNGGLTGSAAQTLQSDSVAGCMSGSTIVIFSSGDYVSLFITDLTASSVLTIAAINITVAAV